MLGILLSRKPSPIEIASDADFHVIRWWKTIQNEEKAEQVKVLLDKSLHHRGMFAEAVGAIGGDDDILHTWGMCLSFYQCLTKSTAVMAYDYAQSYASISSSMPHIFGRKILYVCQRVKRVQFDTFDAMRILDKMRDSYEVLVYCDPPYKGTENYSHGIDDKAFIEKITKFNETMFAVSGTGDQWDVLGDYGWTKHSFETFRGTQHWYTEEKKKRMEVLWTNY